jgi:hypothetical protein
MFRCPKCAQGKTVTVRGSRREVITITMTDDMREVEEFFHKHTHIREDEAKRTYMRKILNNRKDQLCECPKCKESHTWGKWEDAKYNALKYFEMDDPQLCHCGGELWMDNIPGTTAYGFVCDKCNWVKPRAKVSGA